MAMFLTIPTLNHDDAHMRVAYAAIQKETNDAERAGLVAPTYDQDTVARRGTDFMLRRNDLFHLLLPFGPTYTALYLAMFNGHPDQHDHSLKKLAATISAKAEDVTRHIETMLAVSLIKPTESGNYVRGAWHDERRAQKQRLAGQYGDPFDPTTEPAWMRVHDAVHAHPRAEAYFARQNALTGDAAERMKRLMRLDYTWKQFTELSVRMLLIGMRRRQDLAVTLTICLVGPKCTLSRPMLSLLSGASKNILLPCIQHLVAAGVVQETRIFNGQELTPTGWMISGDLSVHERVALSNIETIKCSRALAALYDTSKADLRRKALGVNAAEFNRIRRSVQKIHPLARRLSKEQKEVLLKELQMGTTAIMEPLEPIPPLTHQGKPDIRPLTDAMMDDSLTAPAQLKSRRGWAQREAEKKEAAGAKLSVTRLRELKAQGKWVSSGIFRSGPLA